MKEAILFTLAGIIIGWVLHVKLGPKIQALFMDAEEKADAEAATIKADAKKL